MSEAMEKTTRSVLQAVGTAVLSFLGALGGVYVSSHFDQANWEKRYTLELKKVVLEKRVAILERAVSLLNKKPLLTGLQGSLDAERKLIERRLACEAKQKESNRPSTCSGPSGDQKRVEELGREIYAVNADWAATATLANTYFGDKTKAAIAAAATPHVWYATHKQCQDIIDAMSSEMNEFPGLPS